MKSPASAAATAAKAKRARKSPPEATGFPVVGLGASAGGLEAFTELLRHLPADTGLGFVLVQHLDPQHESALTQLLSRATSMPVREVTNKLRVQPNHVYVIPPNTHLTIERGVLKLQPRQPARAPARSIDSFFESLAGDQREQAIGVILSGTASDGTRGLEAIKAEGGITFAQDASAKYDSMPRSAIAAGCVDFSLYKSSTIRRRVRRRAVLNRQETLEAYYVFLRGNGRELDALHSDLLIEVTSFFRNPEAFEVLKSTVFPRLVEQRGKQPVRVWVLGCSTGQEAYSIAMTYAECAEHVARPRELQVFATDLNEAVLEKARAGLYSNNLWQEVSPERLRRFFDEEEGGYRVNKELRQMVVFARHNVLTDPPFSRMDLISCRNLLIYLVPKLQQRILSVFHYALNPGGYLFLGASESATGFTALFEELDRKSKIFAKAPGGPPGFHLPDRGAHPDEREIPGRPRLPVPEGFPAELNAQREADRVTLSLFAPPGVLVNAELQVLQFRGPTSAYLQPPAGKASFDVLKMSREELVLPLRAALDKAKRENKPVRKERVQVHQDGGTRTLSLQVIPLKNLRERCYLILFEEKAKFAPGIARAAPTPAERAVSRKAEARRGAALERELAETRDYLRSIREQYEAANEELQSQSEEFQSANEELQSINEELETSKEELESTNEELITVNEEMANRNAELNRLNADLHNLHLTVNTPILVLARDLTIRSFTQAAKTTFNLLAADVGRPLSGIQHNLNFPDLEDCIKRVINTLHTAEREVQDTEGAGICSGHGRT